MSLKLILKYNFTNSEVIATVAVDTTVMSTFWLFFFSNCSIICFSLCASNSPFYYPSHHLQIDVGEVSDIYSITANTDVGTESMVVRLSNNRSRQMAAPTWALFCCRFLPVKKNFSPSHCHQTCLLTGGLSWFFLCFLTI